jgi:myo-inositol catabolism protein IolC
MQLIHLETIVLSQTPGIAEEPVLRIVEVFYNSGVTEDWQTLLGIGGESGLHPIHVTICELTSPINNRQHRQLKMETYLNISYSRDWGSTRITGVDRSRRRVGSRHL